MTIRVVLVALVAVLGLDLAEVVSVGRASRDWMTARLLEAPRIGLEAEAVPEGPSTVDFARFAAADDGPERADVVFEAAVESMASTFPADLASASPELAPVVLAVEVDPESNIEKLTEAVRLTRRAVDAWSGLIQAVADPAVTGDRDDSL